MSDQEFTQIISKSSMTGDTTTTASSTTIRPKHSRIQNYLLIWVDVNINEANTDCQNTLARLRSVVREVSLCTTTSKCIEFLNEIDDGKAFVISSGALGQDLVPKIHGMAQVDVIYIFCNNKDWHEQWAKKWTKIQGVFTSINPICESLKKAAYECDHDTMPISFVPKQKTAPTTSGQENLNQLPPAFMYSVLFKEIILEIDDDDAKSVQDLMVYCRQQNITEPELQIFQREYQQKSPIWMYTCEMFLYSMLNKALRSLEMKGMVKMAFFIRHLYKQLEELHKKQSAVLEKKFIVYRGQGLSKEDFQHLYDTQGGLLSFNNFLSTSKKQHVAMEFVQRSLDKNKDTIGVLFIMTIDSTKTSTSNTPFALIDDESAIPQEQEILFSMHTIFRVDDIKQSINNNRLWEVQLTLTDDNDPQLVGLLQSMRKEIDGHGWHRMAKLMYTVGDLDQAEELYNLLLTNSSNDRDRAFIFHQLGRVKWHQGQYTKEVEFYEQSLAIERKTLPEDDPSLANTYNNMGLAYSNMGDDSKAVEFYMKAQQIHEASLLPNDPLLAASYNNIGTLYLKNEDYSKALEYFRKTRKILEETLPSNHPSLATSYNNMGLVYTKMGDNSKALEFYMKVQHIFEASLLPNDPLLATFYNNIGYVYDEMGDYSKALEYYEKNAEITKKALPPNHPSSALSYNNIGTVCCQMGDYSKAVSFLEKALAIWQKSLPPTHPNIQTAIHNIDYAKKKM